MIILILSWIFVTLIQAYNFFIRECIREAIQSGKPIALNIPTLIWDENYYKIKILKFGSPILSILLLLVTILVYNFLTGIIVFVISLIIAFVIGKGWGIYLSS